MKKFLAIMLSFILILTITACSNSTESNDEAITDDAVTTETQDNNSETADTTKEPTRIYPSTYYQAVLTSGDVELVAYFSLSNFTTGGEILESDPITVNKCEYTLEGNALTLTTDANTYVFEKSDDSFIFKADSSSPLYYLDSQWADNSLKEAVPDGTEFNSGFNTYYETSSYTDGTVTIELDVDAMTLKFTSTDGTSFETNLSFDDAGSISVSTDKYSLSGYAMSDVDFFYDLRAVEDFSPISNGYLTINK